MSKDLLQALRMVRRTPLVALENLYHTLDPFALKVVIEYPDQRRGSTRWLDGHFEVRDLPPEHVKGKAEPIVTFAVEGFRGEFGDLD